MVKLLYSCLAGLLTLNQQVIYSTASALAPSRPQNLKSQCKAFLLFCTVYKLKSFPASIHTICMLMQLLFQSFGSVNSISPYVSGIKLLLLAAGIPSHPQSQFPSNSL